MEKFNHFDIGVVHLRDDRRQVSFVTRSQIKEISWVGFGLHTYGLDGTNGGSNQSKLLTAILIREEAIKRQ